MNKRLLVRRSGLGAALGFVALGIYQLVLVAGAPLGEAAWGGTEAHLSPALRVGSACSALFYGLATAVILMRAGFRVPWVSEKLARRGTWALVVILSLSTCANLVSQSPWERFLLGPAALVLAALCFTVARAQRAEDRLSADRDALRALPARRRSDGRGEA